MSNVLPNYRYDMSNVLPDYDMSNVLPDYDMSNVLPNYDKSNVLPDYDMSNVLPDYDTSNVVVFHEKQRNLPNRCIWFKFHIFGRVWVADYSLVSVV